MAIEQYKSSASLNTTLGSLSTAPGMARSDVDDALRQMMADIASGVAPTINPRSYGAVCDGTTDDTAAVQSAIYAAASAKKIMVLPGTIKFGAVTCPANTHIVGPGMKTAVTALAGSYDLFTITGSDVTIENLVVSASAKTGGNEFKIACAGNTIERTTLRNILVWNSMGAITDSGTTGYHITTRIQSVQFRAHNGPGVSWTRGYAFLFLNEVTIDYVGVSTSNYTGFFFDFSGLGAGSGGLFLRDTDVLGTAGTYNLASQRGYDIRNASAVTLLHTRADTVGEKGYVLNNCNKVVLQDVTASLCAGHGFEFTTVSHLSGNGVNAFGRNGLGYSIASQDGIQFVSGCYAVSIVGGVTRDNTGHGVNKAAAQAGAIDMRGMVSTANVGRGVKSTGSSAFHFSGSLYGNTAGNYDLGGGFDYLSSTQLNSGAVVSVGPGPVSA